MKPKRPSGARRRPVPKAPASAGSREPTSRRGNAWLQSHGECATDSLQRLLTAPLASFMTIMVIAIALLLPSLLRQVSQTLGAIDREFADQAQISLYLADTVSEAAGREVSESLLSMEDIESLTYMSKDQALEEFAAYSGLAGLAASLNENPLPATIVVVPVDKSPEGTRQLFGRLQALPEVEAARLDLDWLLRLEALSALLGRVTLLLSVILGLAVLFITGNTIRQAIENRHTEIQVVKLVGGTDSFAARPFLYTGLMLGLAGGILAAFMLLLTGLGFRRPMQELMGMYDNQLPLVGTGPVDLLLPVFAGALLGWLGALASAWQQLHRAEVA